MTVIVSVLVALMVCLGSVFGFYMVNSVMKDLRVHRWVCPGCGTAHDRDVNAARNILFEGLRISEVV